jgi:hypothetical protein
VRYKGKLTLLAFTCHKYKQLKNIKSTIKEIHSIVIVEWVSRRIVLKTHSTMMALTLNEEAQELPSFPIA